MLALDVMSFNAAIIAFAKGGKWDGVLCLWQQMAHHLLTSVIMT